MINTGLLGPYRLTFDGIDAVVAEKAPGVFALGRVDRDGRFCVSHIGRSDEDIKARLRDFIGSDSLFKYGYSPSSEAAFLKECELFHDVAPPRSRVHPGRMRGTSWECPRCRIFAGRG
ncbi:MAG TPA: hypothetical protein VJ740_10895 [Hyphomicrobiaceae bacterium]|jgi:hypothetical protein|nr:hypothetical protein [Hyphomicrobiaceae bacterium]